MSEPTFEPKCTLCNWSKHEPGLYGVFISMAMQEGSSYGAIADALQQHITEQNIKGVKAPGKKNIWTHVQEHMKVDEQAKMTVAKQEAMVVATTPTGETQAITQYLVDKKVNDYEEMCSLYNEIAARCKEIYGDSNALKIENGGGYSNNKIQTYMMMINTRKSILAEMSKMRQSDHLINMATQFIIQEFTKRIVEKMTIEFGAVGETLRRAGVDKSILSAFSIATTKRLAELIESEADSAMDQTRKEFRLS